MRMKIWMRVKTKQPRILLIHQNSSKNLLVSQVSIAEYPPIGRVLQKAQTSAREVQVLKKLQIMMKLCWQVTRDKLADSCSWKEKCRSCLKQLSLAQRRQDTNSSKHSSHNSFHSAPSAKKALICCSKHFIRLRDKTCNLRMSNHIIRMCNLFKLSMPQQIMRHKLRSTMSSSISK